MHEADKHLIHCFFSFGVNDVAVIKVVGLYGFQRTGLVKQSAANGPCLRATNFYDADTASAYGGGDGGNGILEGLAEFHCSRNHWARMEVGPMSYVKWPVSL